MAVTRLAFGGPGQAYAAFAPKTEGTGLIPGYVNVFIVPHENRVFIVDGEDRS